MNIDDALAEIEKAEAQLPREIEEGPLSQEDHRVMLYSWLDELRDQLPEVDRPRLDARFNGMMRRVGLVFDIPEFDGGDGESNSSPRLDDVA